MMTNSLNLFKRHGLQIAGFLTAALIVLMIVLQLLSPIWADKSSASQYTIPDGCVRMHNGLLICDHVAVDE